MMLPTGCKQKQGLKIHLSLDKPKYRLLDDIQATVNIVNNGDPVKINVQFKPFCGYPEPFKQDWNIRFLILNSKGKETFPNCPIMDWGEPPYRLLDAGGVYQFIVKWISNIYRIREPGKYTIQAIYHNANGSPDVWKGEIKSNIVTFTINP
jgi:hypothetical protein